jgi:hypothetical protein
MTMQTKKIAATLFAVALVVAFAGPVSAGDSQTTADNAKAGCCRHAEGDGGEAGAHCPMHAKNAKGEVGANCPMHGKAGEGKACCAEHAKLKDGDKGCCCEESCEHHAAKDKPTAS